MKNAFLVLGICTITAAANCQDATADKASTEQVHSASIVWVNELPDRKQLPPNTTHRTFDSKLAGQKVGYCLYLPPGYE